MKYSKNTQNIIYKFVNYVNRFIYSIAIYYTYNL